MESSKGPVGSEIRYVVDGVPKSYQIKENILCSKNIQQIGRKIQSDREANRKQMMQLAAEIDDDVQRAEVYREVIKDGLERWSVGIDEAFAELQNADTEAIRIVLNNSLDVLPGSAPEIVQEIMDHAENIMEVMSVLVSVGANALECVEKNLSRLETLPANDAAKRGRQSKRSAGKK